MKLTKAQRLFIKAGIEMCEYAYYKWVDTCDNCDVSCDIVEHRKKYKQIIRAALRAYELEIADAFTAGYELCKSTHNISEEFMLVDGDIIF